MSEELTIEQPSSGVWLAPGKRIGHLVAIFNCTDKKMEFDKMSGKEKEKATFDFVDLDQECALMAGYDNHPGVTFKLKVGNPNVVLGRVTTQPSQYAQDAVVLAEHTEADAQRLRNWHKAQAAGYRQAPVANPAAVPAAQPVSAPVAAPAATPIAQALAEHQPPAMPAAAGTVPQLDLSTLDPATLQLLMKAAGQVNGGTA